MQQELNTQPTKDNQLDAPQQTTLLDNIGLSLLASSSPVVEMKDSTSSNNSSSRKSRSGRRDSVDYLREVVEIGKQDMKENASHQNDTDSLIQTFIDLVNNEEENWKKRKREACSSQQEHACHAEEHASVWDIIPQKFTHVKLHANEIPSTDFCKIMFLYGWAYSKYLIHMREEHAQNDSSPTSPILSQDGSNDDTLVVEPPLKKVSRTVKEEE